MRVGLHSGPCDSPPESKPTADMADQHTEQHVSLGGPLDQERVFRPGKKGAWHLLAQREYGVLWSHCGIRIMAKECEFPKEPILIRDLCGTCGRIAKEALGKESRKEKQ